MRCATRTPSLALRASVVRLLAPPGRKRPSGGWRPAIDQIAKIAGFCFADSRKTGILWKSRYTAVIRATFVRRERVGATSKRGTFHALFLPEESVRDSSSKGIHAGRIAGGDHDHRDFSVAIVAGGAEGPRIGAEDAMREQCQAVGLGAAELPYDLWQVSAQFRVESQRQFQHFANRADQQRRALRGLGDSDSAAARATKSPQPVRSDSAHRWQQHQRQQQDGAGHAVVGHALSDGQLQFEAVYGQHQQSQQPIGGQLGARAIMQPTRPWAS